MMDFRFIARGTEGLEIWARFTDHLDNVQWIYKKNGEQFGSIQTTSYGQLMMQNALYNELNRELFKGQETDDEAGFTRLPRTLFKTATAIEVEKYMGRSK